MARALPEESALVAYVRAESPEKSFYAAFVLIGPFAAVRDLVGETLDDFLPARHARVLNRLRG